MSYQSVIPCLLVFITVVLVAMYILDAIDNRSYQNVCYIEVNGNRAFVRGCEINEQLASVIRELKPVKFTC
ncbi:triple gene block protein 4 [Banana mild mosaic virus]|uniref:Movement protein TGBp3 n=1 Tax=Banana mild mosaic virus TaxID=148879 RepID=Q993S4_9VIRU|nr:triple gene block protein 4 [Banmivirus BanMMV]AAK28492.1 triple gene block protein 4 [Banmivirus BanMMV]